MADIKGKRSHEAAFPDSEMADIKGEYSREAAVAAAAAQVEGSKQDAAPEITITNCEVISSYTWLLAKEGTIAVPGLPAEWSSPQVEPLVEADIGPRILDFNLYYYPHSPMEPAIYAVLHLHPQFDFSALDIVNDKQPLALLLSLAYAKKEGWHCNTRVKKFEGKKFEAQAIGNTIVFTRGDGKNISKNDGRFQGFRKGFDDQYLKRPAGFEDGDAHFGLTSYQLGGIKIMVRHSVDASMVPTQTAPATSADGAISATAADTGPMILSKGSLMKLNDIAEINTFANKDCHRRYEKQREAWLSQCGHYVVVESQETGHDNNRLDFEYRRASFPWNRMDFSKAEQPPASVLKTYHDCIDLLVHTIRNLAAKSQKKLFTVTFDAREGEPVISDRFGGAEVSPELSKRMLETK